MVGIVQVIKERRYTGYLREKYGGKETYSFSKKGTWEEETEDAGERGTN